MRAVAVMLVVIGHAGLADRVPGGSGVTIFFGISGFIITFLLLREQERTRTFDVRAFYARRALKILPPLTLVVIIPTLISGLFSPIHWRALLGVVFFYFNWLFLNGVGEPFPGSAVVWSLSIEEQFYLAFAIVWAAALRFRIRTESFIASVVLVALLSLAARIGFVTFSRLTGEALENRIYYATDTRIEAIAFGVLTAFAFFLSTVQPGATRRRDGAFHLGAVVRFFQTDAALTLAGCFFLASLAIRDEWFRYTFRFSIQALAACVVIIYGFGTCNTLVRRCFDFCVHLKAVQIIGLASYSIYLIHLTVMLYAKPFLAGVSLSLQVPALTLAGVLSGISVYYLVERPIQQWKKRR